LDLLHRLADRFNRHVIALKKQFNPTQPKELPRLQNGFNDRLAVNESAVAGAEIGDRGRRFIQDHLSVGTGNGNVIDHDIVPGVTTEKISAGL